MKHKEDLKAEKDRRGLKWTEIARQMKIPYSRLTGWYKQNTNPSADDIIKISKWLNESQAKDLPVADTRDYAIAVLTERLAILLAALNKTTAISERLLIEKDIKALIDHESSSS